jgi:hypothetical protein
MFLGSYSLFNILEVQAESSIADQLLKYKCSVCWNRIDGKMHIISLHIFDNDNIPECLVIAKSLPFLVRLDITPSDGVNSEQIQELHKINSLKKIYVLGRPQGTFAQKKSLLHIKDVFSQIAHMRSLKTLILKDIHIDSTDDFEELSNLINLEQFAIGRVNNIPQGSFKYLQSLKHLKECNIHYNLSDEDFGYLLTINELTFLKSIFFGERSGITSLKSLKKLSHLNYCGDVTVDIVNTLNQMPNLMSLQFNRNNFEKGSLRNIDKLSTIKHLELIRCHIPDEEQLIHVLSRMNGVQELVLDSSDFSRKPCDFTLLKTNPNLKSLVIGNCTNYAGINSLTQIQHLKLQPPISKTISTQKFVTLDSLQQLDINNCTILKKMPYLPNLTKISFYESKIIDDSFFSFYNNSFSHVSLKRTSVHDTAILQLLQKNTDTLISLELTNVKSQKIIDLIAHCCHLKSLSINISEVSGCDLLFKNLTSLEKVKLSMNTLSKEIIVALSILPNLHTLDISQCHINKEQILLLKNSSSIQELIIKSSLINSSIINSLPFQTIHNGSVPVDLDRIFFDKYSKIN